MHAAESFARAGRKRRPVLSLLCPEAQCLRSLRDELPLEEAGNALVIVAMQRGALLRRRAEPRESSSKGEASPHL